MTDAAATQASRPVYTDVRFVVHAAAPGSLDAYDQEVGRERTGRRPGCGRAVPPLPRLRPAALTAPRPRPDVLRRALAALRPDEHRSPRDISVEA
jgi:ATP-dependent DNA helicase RecQ